MNGGTAMRDSVGSLRILSVEKIWDRAPHSAFTDLIRFEGRWWCTFREAEDHGGSIGTVRVICSGDGESWEPAAVVEEVAVDLRDPKLSVMPDGRLMLVMGGSLYRGKEYRTILARTGLKTFACAFIAVVLRVESHARGLVVSWMHLWVG